MLIYTCDGSFEGLLTSIFEAYNRKENPSRILLCSHFQESLIEEKVHIETDDSKAKRVLDSIITKISHNSFEKIYYTYLSEHEDCGTWIYNYIRLGLKMGRAIDNHLSDDFVLKVHKTSLKVLGERHLLLGLLRFQEIGENIFYAPIEPQHNVIELIAPHFVNRLPNENWIIHDKKRGLAAVYDKNNLAINPTDFTGTFDKSPHEDSYQTMWKSYFKSIAIKNRINPKLQRRNMPSRYWNYLTEKQLY